MLFIFSVKDITIKLPDAKQKRATKKKPATIESQQNDDDTNEEEPNLNTSNASQNDSVGNSPKKEPLKAMMAKGIKILTDRDEYSSLRGVEKYLKTEKEFDITKNHARIKSTLNGFFAAETIKQRDPRKNFSISVQFVMNNKKKATVNSIDKRKSLIMAEKKKKQNDAKKKASKKASKKVGIYVTSGETNGETNGDTNGETPTTTSAEHSDDVDVPVAREETSKKVANVGKRGKKTVEPAPTTGAEHSDNVDGPVVEEETSKKVVKVEKRGKNTIQSTTSADDGEYSDSEDVPAAKMKTSKKVANVGKRGKKTVEPAPTTQPATSAETPSATSDQDGEYSDDKDVPIVKKTAAKKRR